MRGTEYNLQPADQLRWQRAQLVRRYSFMDCPKLIQHIDVKDAYFLDVCLGVGFSVLPTFSRC